METDRRRFSRVVFHGDATLSVADGEQAVDVLDVSLKGALIRLRGDHRVVAGMPGVLNLPLSDSEQIHMQVVVAHDLDGCHGLLCQDIDLDSVTHLRRLIELNLGDAELAERELGQLLRD